MAKFVKTFIVGALGALCMWGSLVVGTWVYNRWTEFKIMRADIVFIHPQIEAARQQATKGSN